MLSRWAESKPYVGIFASLSGFGATVLALLQDISVIFGCLGAILGFAAGYYTWRIKRQQWLAVRDALAPARKIENSEIAKIHDAGIRAASKTYEEVVQSLKK